MPNPKNQLDQYAQGYQEALSQPKPSSCPTCGHVSSSDDVPEPDPKSASEVEKGATRSGAISFEQAWKNLKEGMGGN